MNKYASACTSCAFAAFTLAVTEAGAQESEHFRNYALSEAKGVHIVFENEVPIECLESPKSLINIIEKEMLLTGYKVYSKLSDAADAPWLTINIGGFALKMGDRKIGCNYGYRMKLEVIGMFTLNTKKDSEPYFATAWEKAGIHALNNDSIKTGINNLVKDLAQEAAVTLLKAKQ